MTTERTEVEYNRGRAERDDTVGLLGRTTIEAAALVAALLVLVLLVEVLRPDRDTGTTQAPTTATPTATAPSTPAAVSAAETPVSAPPARTAAVTGTTSTPPDLGADPVECDFRDELERVRGAVVRIRSIISLTRDMVGTGFHIGGGQYVTAAHVVQDEFGNTYDHILVESATSQEKELVKVERIGSFDPARITQQRDLAVLLGSEIEYSIQHRAPSDEDVGRDVHVLGYPWSQVRDETAEIQQPVVVRGSLTNTAMKDNVAIVQADVTAGSGMSGGPLVDACGFAIAVASALPQASPGQEGAGLTVFISMVEVDQLLQEP